MENRFENINNVNNYQNESINSQILKNKDLYDIFGCKSTFQKIIKSIPEFPATQIGNVYYTTYGLIENWIKKNIGKKFYLS